jgi:hypothetical protein
VVLELYELVKGYYEEEWVQIGEMLPILFYFILFY